MNKELITIIGGTNMKKEYDFSNSKKNPYAKHLKRQVSIRLNVSAISYFKGLAEETGMNYQNLINLYLLDCAEKHKRPKIAWR